VSEELLRELRRKWLPIYVLLLLSLVFVLLHLAVNYMNTGNTTYVNWAIPVVFFALYTAYALSKLLRTRIPVYHYYRVIKCAKCGYEITEEIKEGDYLFREHGECPKCSGVLLVSKIYRKKSLRGVL